MICIDLDGTLLNSQGAINEADLHAVQAAVDAGVRVMPCTGRSWCESRHVLHGFPFSPLSDTGVFVTGAAVSDLADGRTLDLCAMDPRLVLEVVEHLWDLPEAVLVCCDANLAGHDYLITGRGQVSANTKWWFETTGVTVRHNSNPSLDDLRHTLRVGIVAAGPRMEQTSRRVRAAFGPRVAVHHFAAVQKPDPDQTVHILEVFAAGVDKWRGLSWLAQKDGIAPEQIAAIGDELNDVAMLSQSGCGIAMANATQAAIHAADRVTRSCDEGGVGHAIESLLSGRWV